ncbi:PDZ domain-containing protein [Bacillus sp. B15-48]|nr:PDZ domain-containing protein [Bacillus sp. B15-48]
MLMFFIVFLTAGITTFALAFGDDEKAVRIVQDRQEFTKLYDAYDTLRENYYIEVDKEKLIDGAINGMIESLDDPYSDYMSQEDAKKFHESISASFEGIGAEIQARDGYIVIVSPLKGSPAEKAGLLPEDVILSVDGESIQGMTTTEAVALIRGEKGTKVKLTIKRADADPTDVTITRDTIPIETVYGEMIDGEIGQVQITNFSEHTYDELVVVLKDLQDQGMKGLVLDLRQNPGGLLDQALKITSLFVPAGEVIFQVEDKEKNIEEFSSAGNGPIDFPLVVLVDKGSASASEILAGAVSESTGVPLIGQTTFGKGTVQRAENFRDGSNIKLTTDKWLTPNGNWIHQKGIKPDYEVDLPEYASLPFIDPEAELTVSIASEQVKSAQTMLQVLGYNPGREDGFFDEKTSEAVKQFQKDRELEVTGVLTGSSTLELMSAVRNKMIEDDPQMKKAIEVLKKEMK